MWGRIEARGAGRQVIASNNSGTVEAVGDAALLIDPYRGAEEIAAALTALADNEVYYNNLAERGYERVSMLNKNFNLHALQRVWQNYV